jgi:ParB-like chromosome segregation protein Spo0J
MRSTKPDLAAAPALAKHIEHWPVNRLIPYARNARTHSDAQVAQIAASIREFGFTNPILVDTGDGIIAGHGRLLAARLLKLETVPVIVLDHLTETQKRAYIIADNKLAENAGWDDEALQVELAELKQAGFDLDLVGFDDEELARLLAQSATDGLTDEDAVPELTETPVTIPGDLWIFGEHRVHGGDATSANDIAKLMVGEAADLVFTDPPYNVDYQGYTDERLTIQNDKMTPEEFRQFLESTFRSYRTVVKKGASLYVCHSSSMQRVPGRNGDRRLRSPLSDHLGQEHICMGLRPVQVPARADLLQPRGRREGSRVWRQVAIDALGREEACSESPASDDETG